MEVDLKDDGDGMTTSEVNAKAKQLKLVNFKCVMRDELKGKRPFSTECGIINLNTSKENGSHYSRWYKNGVKKILF